MPRSFFHQECTKLAPLLLGKLIQVGPVVVRILETEAYMPEDSACHAYKGKTKRNAPMYELGGTLYVYLCYGLHQMLNIVGGEKGSPQAVLVRAGEVIQGEDIVCARRKNLDLIGPGKLAQALGVDRSYSGDLLYHRIHLWDAPSVAHTTLPRVGIDYALPKDRDALWRFVTPPTRPLVQKKTRSR